EPQTTAGSAPRPPATEAQSLRSCRTPVALFERRPATARRAGGSGMGLQPLRILLRTTIPTTEDVWAISRLAALPRAQRDEMGRSLYRLVLRNCALPGRPDPVLSTIDEGGFDLASYHLRAP